MSKSLKKRINRLSPLIRMSEQAVNESLSHLGRLQQQYYAERKRKDSLLLYQEEYQANFSRQGAHGINAKNIQQHESFMYQVDQALSAQDSHLHSLEKQLQDAKSLYQRLNSHFKRYQKLKERMTAKVNGIEEKQLQMLLDELATQKAARHSQSDL